MQFPLSKMFSTVDNSDRVHYSLLTNEKKLNLNTYIGKTITLTFTGNKQCQHYQTHTETLYGDGYCKQCNNSLARCDICRIKPELCHYKNGTCREPLWGENNCLKSHYIYLSNTSGVKVGITRHTNDSTRWVDQGAIKSLPLFKVYSREHAGLFEREIAENFSDRTNINKVLTDQRTHHDLIALRNKILPALTPFLTEFKLTYGLDSVDILEDNIRIFKYPVLTYPNKVKRLSFDKTPVITGKLNGIIGQYLFINDCVINIRKFSGYIVKIHVNN